MLPSTKIHRVGTPNSLISRLNSPACTYPSQRFAAALTSIDAWFGAIVVRYSFDAELSHLLLHAGLSRRSDLPVSVLVTKAVDSLWEVARRRYMGESGSITYISKAAVELAIYGTTMQAMNLLKRMTSELIKLKPRLLIAGDRVRYRTYRSTTGRSAFKNCCFPYPIVKSSLSISTIVATTSDGATPQSRCRFSTSCWNSFPFSSGVRLPRRPTMRRSTMFSVRGIPSPWSWMIISSGECCTEKVRVVVHAHCVTLAPQRNSRPYTGDRFDHRAVHPTVCDSASLAQDWNDRETGTNTLGSQLAELQTYVALEQLRCEGCQLLGCSGAHPARRARFSAVAFFRHT